MIEEGEVEILVSPPFENGLLQTLEVLMNLMDN
jgi:hypothetical protein